MATEVMRRVTDARRRQAAETGPTRYSVAEREA
jgi:hypothetical protein